MNAWPPPDDAYGCIRLYINGEHVGGGKRAWSGGGWDAPPAGEVWTWRWDGEVPDVDHIAAWPFDEAPGELRALSRHGGDEDWLALVPARLAEMWIPWLEHGPFGVCDISKHTLPDGRVVFIGAHA